MKIPVIVSLMRSQDQQLTATQLRLARAAITESNNEAVLALFSDLEREQEGLQNASAWIDETLRAGEDSETEVATAPPPPRAATTFGQTLWSPSNSVKFFSALARRCLLHAAATKSLLQLMEEIVPAQSWGVGAAGFASAAFKDGWGPEASGELVRQSGIVNLAAPESAVVFAIVAHSHSYDEGTQMVTKAARWLKAELHVTPEPAELCTS